MSSLRRALKLSIEESHARNNGCSDSIESRRGENKAKAKRDHELAATNSTAIAASIMTTNDSVVADGVMPSLTEAEASGCTKCQKELDTGEKMRIGHDDFCPRKRGGNVKQKESDEEKMEDLHLETQCKSSDNDTKAKASEHDDIVCQPRSMTDDMDLAIARCSVTKDSDPTASISKSERQHDHGDTNNSRKSNDCAKISEHDEIIRQPTEDDDMDSEDEDELGAYIYKSSLIAKSQVGASISNTETVTPNLNLNSSVLSTRMGSNPLQRLRNMNRKRPHEPSSEGSMSPTMRETGGNMKIALKSQHQPSPESIVPQTTVSESNNAFPNVGDVGYTFRKQFEGYGWFTGKVVKIRPGADEYGGCRRCVYEDGDSEDLNLTQLQALARLDPENNKKSNHDQQGRGSEHKASRDECKKKKKTNPDPVSLDKAATSGCRKCQVELDTGEKSRLAHDESCNLSAASGRRKRQKHKNDCTLAAAAASGCRKCQRELDSGVKNNGAHDESCPRKGKSVHSRASATSVGGSFKGNRKTRDANPASLAKGAASGCSKCRKELNCGKKTNYPHQQGCPRKWKSAGGTHQTHAVQDEDEELMDNEFESEEGGNVQDANHSEEEIQESEYTLAAAAASGCRKCQRELESGEKNAKAHDESCPRKMRKAGGCYKTQAKKHASVRHENTEDDDSEEEIQESDCTLAAAAASGCRKCQRELESGVKNAKAHDESCPRKMKKAGGCFKTQAKKYASVRHENTEDDDSEEEIQESDYTLAAGAASGCRKCQNELNSGEKRNRAHDGCCPRKWKNVGRKTVISLDKAAASGCRKCQKELDSGDKIRSSHDEGCPRKWGYKEMYKNAQGDESEEETPEIFISQNKRVWTLREDMELFNRVRKHGEGSWKEILDDSPILQERYKTAPSVKHARVCIRMRWPFTLKKVKAWNDNDFSDRAHDNESGAIFTNKRRPQPSPEGTTSNKCAQITRSTRLVTESNIVANVGDVGYIFRKQFEGYGWYTGKVVKIRPRADEHGGDRRCEYDDGDAEYLNLTQLQALARLDPENKSVHQPTNIGQGARLGRSEQKASHKECKKKTNPNPHPVSLGRAAASGCRKCQAELNSGEKTRLAHDEGCSHAEATPSNKTTVSDKCSATNYTSILHDHTTRRSMRKRSAPDHFVARPSKSGIGVKDGDEEFLAATEKVTGEATGNAMVSLAKKRTRKDNSNNENNTRKDSKLSTTASWERHKKEDISRIRGRGTRWTLEEDRELRKRVRLHGEGNWKDILDNSRILQQRYRTALSAEHARIYVRARWENNMRHE